MRKKLEWVGVGRAIEVDGSAATSMWSAGSIEVLSKQRTSMARSTAECG
ncbi:MAG: hypothetical protein U0640_14240 [Phycisphaerales bacterium]